MKLTLLATVFLVPLLQWPFSAFAETNVTPDVDQIILYQRNSNETPETPSQKGLVKTKSSMQSGSCPRTVTQWEDTVVLELLYDPGKCLSPSEISARDLAPLLVLQQLQTSFVETYHYIQGRLCDPYARRVVAVSIVDMKKRSATGVLAVKMKVTSVCQEGCEGLSLGVYDLPDVGTAGSQPTATSNCACTRNFDGRAERGPYKSDFFVLYQQVVQSSFEDNCVNLVSSCSYGSPFNVRITIPVDFDGTSLSADDIKVAAQAFKTASNAGYAATSGDCQPEF